MAYKIRPSDRQKHYDQLARAALNATYITPLLRPLTPIDTQAPSQSSVQQAPSRSLQASRLAEKRPAPPTQTQETQAQARAQESQDQSQAGWQDEPHRPFHKSKPGRDVEEQRQLQRWEGPSSSSEPFVSSTIRDLASTTTSPSPSEASWPVSRNPPAVMSNLNPTLLALRRLLDSEHTAVQGLTERDQLPALVRTALPTGPRREYEVRHWQGSRPSRC